MPERGDPPPGLHGILDRCCAITEVGGRHVDVRHDVRDPPESGRTLARSVGRTDDFDEHLPEPEEDLADRSAAELAVRSRRGSTPTVASDSTVRPRSGDSSTTWSIAETPFACSAGAAATASDLVVGMPSRSSSAPSDGRPRNDQPTMPVPWPRPTSRMRTPPIRQTASESTPNPACIQASAGSATSNSSTEMVISLRILHTSNRASLPVVRED